MADSQDRDIILFVHGAWHGAWCWEEHFVNLFSVQGFECHTFNLPLHDKPGKVKGINKLSLGDYVDALSAEVKKLDRLPIIIGHSMGGLVVQKYLENATCKKAVLMASVPPQGVLRTTLNFLKKPYAYPALLSMNLYGLVDQASKSAWAFFSESLGQEAIERYTERMCSESYKVFIQMLFPNIKIKYHTEIPMLVIGAEQDNIFTVKENKDTANKYGADLIIMKDIAHDMMLDLNHEKAAEAIIRWLGNEETV